MRSHFLANIALINDSARHCFKVGDQKAPFSIATTPRCREGATPFPGLLHFTLGTYLKLLSVKQGGIKYHF